jgi:hypothetical protein
VDVLIGPFVDSTDGDTEETALTISRADVLLSKNGQALTQKTDVTAAAHDADGYYNCELDATDTDTIGQLVLAVHEAGALAVRHEFQVIEEAVYDRDYKAAATGVDADWTNAGRLDELLDAVNTVTPDAAGVAPTVTEIQAEMEENGASILDTLRDKLVGITLLSEWLGAIAGKQNADATALAEIKASGAGSGTYDPNADSTEALRDLIGAAGAGLTDLGGMSTGMKAEIEVEAGDALDASIAELSQGVPATTPSVRTALMLLYMALRNKTDVATSGTDTLEIHNNAGTRIAQKLLADAGGDYSEAKMTSGA